MLIYHYDNTTGELIGSSEADLDPIEQKPLVPAYATSKKPPTIPVGKVAVFSANTWDLVEDFRGQTFYSKETKIPVLIQEIGPVDSSLTIYAPLDGPCLWDESAICWIVDQATVDAIALATLKNGAQQALDASDKTVLRCFEKGITLPQEWVTYRDALRSVKSGTSIVALPVRPNYPAGT